MKVYQALLPLAAAMLVVGCGSRSTAQSVIGQAEGAVGQVREEATITAPAELKTAEGTLAKMKASFEERDYKDVVAVVPQFNTELDALKAAVTSNQAVAAAATQEWTTLNAEVPPSIEALQARVDSLKPAALPRDVTKEELETAKTELETLKTTWAEATAAAQAGHPVEAADKGRVVQAKAEELKNSLGMNETLASTAG